MRRFKTKSNFSPIATKIITTNLFDKHIILKSVFNPEVQVFWGQLFHPMRMIDYGIKYEVKTPHRTNAIGLASGDFRTPFCGTTGQI